MQPTKQIPRSPAELTGRILVVDDDASIQHLLIEILRESGYACTGAFDAEKARQHLADQNFDLLICDINMPGESGLDFSRHVISENPDTAVIMSTGLRDTRLADEALKIGAYDYITKPFEPRRVTFSVANALLRRELEMVNRDHRKQLETLVADRTEKLHAAVWELQKAKAGLMSHEKAEPVGNPQLEDSNLIRRTLLATNFQLEAAAGELDVPVAALKEEIGKLGIYAIPIANEYLALLQISDLCIDRYLESMEAKLVREALQISKSRKQAATFLGISSRSLKYRMEKLGLKGRPHGRQIEYLEFIRYSSLDRFLKDIENQIILKALKIAGGNQTKTAAFLGISYRSLRYRLENIGG